MDEAYLAVSFGSKREDMTCMYAALGLVATLIIR